MYVWASIAILILLLQLKDYNPLNSLNNTKKKDGIKFPSILHIYKHVAIAKYNAQYPAWSRHSPAIVKKFAICMTLNLIVHQVGIITAIDGGEFLVYMHRSNLTRAILQLLKSFYGLNQSRQLQNQNAIAFFKSLDFIAVERRPQHLHPTRIKRRSQPHHCLYKSLLVIIEQHDRTLGFEDGIVKQIQGQRLRRGANNTKISNANVKIQSISSHPRPRHRKRPHRLQRRRQPS